MHSGGVGAGESYSETVTATLPGLLPGEYFVIVRSDIRNQIPENREENNIGGSLEEVAIATESLELGVAETGTLAEGQSVYYQVQVEAGETLLVNFDSVSETAANELYIRYNDIPSRNKFDFRFSEEFAPDQEIVVPNTLAGTYHETPPGAWKPRRFSARRKSDSAALAALKLITVSIFSVNWLTVFGIDALY